MAGFRSPFAATLPWVPKLAVGTIAIWPHHLASLPRSWQVCDGTNGTPDLSDRFVIGRYGSITPPFRDGDLDHEHDLETDGHTHSFPPGLDYQALLTQGRILTTETDTAETDTKSNLPPYMALYYVMYTAYH